jgi:HEAT repeat protein
MSGRTVYCWIVLGSLLPFASQASIAADTSDEYRQLVVKLIGDNDPEFRAAGLEQVRTAAKGSDATKLFASRLSELNPDGQIALVSALADRADSAAHPGVVALLNSSADESVRVAAIRALGKLGGPADLKLLLAYLPSKSSAEQAAARAALTQMQEESVSKSLVAELPSVSAANKAALIEVLGARRASNALPAFLAATLDDNGQVRRAAMVALGQLGSADQLSGMVSGILKAPKGGERDAAERSVALVCSRIDDEGQRGDQLIKALDTVQPQQRDELLPLVGRVGGKKLIDFVGQIATDGDPQRRKLGIDALSKWPDASTADKLLEIAGRTNDSAERKQAFQGYVKVAATRDKRNDRERLDRMKQAMQAAKTTDEQLLVINRCRTAYDVDTLRFVLPYLDKAPFADAACETIVELAHHREIRDPNKEEFNKALDRVIASTKNPEYVERANRYKRGETWERQAKAAN